MEEFVRYDARRLEEAAAAAEETVRAGTYSSAVLAVGDRARIIWSHSVPGDDRTGMDTIFAIASVTKPIVATALMQLVERGRLLLNDPVARFIPEFGQSDKERVTIWHLLTHTSGIDERGEVLERLFGERAPSDAYLRAACESGLRFEPGTQYAYCNLAFIVLAELIIRLGDQPYPEYLRRHIFAPLGMIDTDFSPTDPARVAPNRDFAEPEVLAYFNSLAVPAGGLWSTAPDLLAFGRALLDGGRQGEQPLLGPAAIETMTRLHTAGLTQMVDGRPRPSYSGLGWGKRGPTGVILGSERSFGHGGSTGAFLWIDPAWDLVFVFLGAAWKPDDEDVGRQRDAQRILNIVYGALRQRLGP